MKKNDRSSFGLCDEKKFCGQNMTTKILQCNTGRSSKENCRSDLHGVATGRHPRETSL